MTRGLGYKIVATALAALLGGCAGTTAGDSDVVDDWPVMASASLKVPPSGVCYSAFDTFAQNVGALFTVPIACTDQHAVEVFHVGDLPGDVTVRPERATPAYWRMFEECERKAKEFLGDDWFNGRLYLTATMPLARQWDGGHRWYRCELIETKSMRTDALARREGTLAGTLRDAAPLAQRCADMVGDKTPNSWDDLSPVDCAQPHDAEYVGSFRVPGTAQLTNEQMAPVYEGCRDVIARFMGGTRNGVRVGYLAWFPGGDGWQRGDRYVRCYAWGDGRRIVGSVKGIGNAAPRTG